MATRSLIEGELIERCRVALQTAGIAKYPADDDPPRPYLNGPIRRGLEAVGHPPADPWAVADADFATVPPVRISDLLDLAELTTLERAYSNIADVDIRTTDVDEKRSQYADRLADRIKALRDDLSARLGLGVPTATAGVLDLGFTDPDAGSEWG